MSYFLLTPNALIVFLLITTVGFVFLLASFLLGDLFEMFSQDSGGSAHEMGIFDTRVISIFATAFGGFGALGMMTGLGVAVSSLLGLIGGIVLGAAVFFFGRMLYQQQSSSSISAHHLIGRIAEVIVTIHPNSIGKVSCRIGEERIEKLAVSRDNNIIKIGTLVVIESVTDEYVTVCFDEAIARLYLPNSDR
ncbi:MAG TPA: hypothetical protein VEF04_02540 [Blastocatellia bacterium]|nr:hypothetical protein [Blastocatellia bacterium]